MHVTTTVATKSGLRSEKLLSLFMRVLDNQLPPRDSFESDEHQDCVVIDAVPADDNNQGSSEINMETLTHVPPVPYEKGRRRAILLRQVMPTHHKQDS